MTRSRRKRRTNDAVEAGRRMKKYLVTILPTFGPIEIVAENPQDVKELAAHHWDVGWDGEFVTEIEEKP